MSESSKSRYNEYDLVTYHHYQEFELRRLKRSSEDFQQLFEDIMVRARPGFVRVRPYGNIGDRKCDGLFREDSIFFQVYSPDEVEQAKVQKKIDEDLDGAVAHWGASIKTWVFVYNVRRGVAPDILGTLQEKQKKYPNVKIEHLSNDDLWAITRDLSIEKRNEILSLPPSITKTEQTTARLVSNQEHEIKWRETCRDLLDHWKGLTTNALTKPNGVRFQLDEIFVPLGVVERQKKPKYSSNDGASAEQGSELYAEQVTPISQNDFFEKVLRQRQSKYSQGDRIAIVGEPGAGKTTQLQKIGDWILNETDGIPIWIPLGVVGTRNLKEYLLGDWLQTAIQDLEVSQQHRDALGQLLKTEKVWFLLDGVDEMAVSDALHQIATQMGERWLQNVRIVLTCRLNVWDAGKNSLDGFDVYRNLDFEYPNEVHQVIDKWFTTEAALQQQLKVALEQPGKERIRDMVKNPLRLTLLCYSWQLQQGELPETKAGLYEWFVDSFYEWNRGKVPIQLSAAKREELNRALGELAKEAIDQKSSCFRLREQFINRFLGAANDEDSLFYLALQLGWLNRIGVAEENPLENVYAFFHPTFQEYFAALAIDDWRYFLNHNNEYPNPTKPYKGRACVYRIFDSWWKESMVIWIESKKTKEEYEREVEKSLKNFKDGCSELFYSNQISHVIRELPGSEEFITKQEFSQREQSNTIQVNPGTILYALDYINFLHQFIGLNNQEMQDLILEVSGEDKLQSQDMSELINQLDGGTLKRKSAIRKLARGITFDFGLVGEFLKEMRKAQNIVIYLASAWILNSALYSRKIFITETDERFDFSNDSVEVLSNIVLFFTCIIRKIILEREEVLSVSKEGFNWMFIQAFSLCATTLCLVIEDCQINEISKIVIRQLKDCLLVCDFNSSFHTDIYNIVLRCSNLPYTDFYRAWHGSSTANAELPVED